MTVLTEIFLFCGQNAPLFGHHKNEGKKKRNKKTPWEFNSHESCEKKSKSMKDRILFEFVCLFCLFYPLWKVICVFCLAH